jgi:spore maturation protein CgeB
VYAPSHGVIRSPPATTDVTFVESARRVGIVNGPGVIGPQVIDAYERAFRALGHQTRTASLSAPGPQLVAEVTALLEWNPDLVIGYGHNAIISNPGGPIFRRAGIPVAALHYDCPFFVLGEPFKTEFREHREAYHHFIWDQAFLAPFSAMGFRNVHPILLAADTEVFTPAQPHHRFDLSFVGRRSDAAAARRQRQQGFSAAMNEFVDQTIAAKVEQPALPTLAHWEAIRARRFPALAVDWRDSGMATVYLAIHREATPLVRDRALRTLRGVHPTAFGAGWESLEGVLSQPEVDYRRELPAVYADSRINLNITSAQLESSINNRVFDVAATGAFLLTDHRADLAKVFPDHAAFSWRTYEELDAKAAHFLAHEGQRLELARELQKAVLANHTYRHRAEYVLEQTGFSAA